MPLRTQTIAQPAPTVSTRRSLMARLPLETQQRLVSQCTRVQLTKGQRLTEAGTELTWSYLLSSGLVSLQTMTEEGDSVEIAMIGSDGIVGLPLGATSPIPHTAIVVIHGDAFRVRADVLRREFESDASVRHVMIQYWHELTMLIAQGSVCHRFHTARQRLASWLLAAADRTHSLRIQMTQERLGDALGLQRTGVTTASIALQDAGAIRARHGRITIVDRGRVEAMACECYRLICNATRE